MRKIRSIISILLSIVLLLSSISVVSIVSFAEGNTLTKIENTFDDEGVEYTTEYINNQAFSIRTVNGVKDDYKFSSYGTSIEKYATDNNAIKFHYAVSEENNWPAVAKLYDDKTENKAQFRPKENTSYSIKFKYNVTTASTRDLVLELRQLDTVNPAQKLYYNKTQVLIPNIATITKNTTTDGWVEAYGTFTTGDAKEKPEYLYLNITSPNGDSSGFEVWVDDIVIEELCSITINNYTPNQNKTIGMAQGSKVSDITIPTVSNFRFDGIYADADYTVPLSAETVIDAYAYGTIYFKWVKLTPQQYFCDFENYGSSVVSAYDKAVASLVSDTVYNGNMAMKAALKNKGITAFEIRTKDAFYITKGTQYEVSFAYKTDADAQISVGLAKATDVCGSAVAYATTTVSATDSWQTATLTLTADKGTDDAYALAMLAFAENGANIYFDDILVTDMTERDTVNMPTVPTDTYPTIGKAKEIWDGTIATKFAGGTGTQADPYLISNGKELALAITQSGAGELYYGKYYKITKDIYLNDINAVDWSSGAKNSGYTVHSWYDYFQNGTTIEGEDFAGVIDGAGFTVYGLYYKHGESIKSTANIKLASGLIPGTAEGFNSEVSNLGIDYAYVHHKFTAGIVVGTSQVSDNITVSNSYVGQNVKVSGNSAGAFVGAGADGKRNVTLTNCYSLASYATGVKNYGLAAYLYNTTATIKNCYNSNGPLTSYSYANWATTYNFYNSYETVESGTSNATTKKNVYQITAENMQGTDVFTNEEKMPYLALNTNGSANTAYTATKGYPILTAFVKEVVNDNSANENVAAWDGNLPEALEGDGNEASPYLIKNGGDLAYAITSGGGNNKYYKLTSDIYLNDATDFNLNTGYAYDSNLNKWYFDQAFSGTIDGDGHTIYGLYYRNDYTHNPTSAAHGAGLVPKVEAGKTVTIKNLSIDKAYIGNRFAAAAFVGVVNGTSADDSPTINIVNSYVGSQVNIVGCDAGAFIAYGIYYTTTITNSYSLATVDGANNRGLIGYYSATTTNISNSYNANGPVSTYSGGKAVSATVSNSYATEQSGHTIFDSVILRTKENMKGSDVLTNAYKMPKLGSAFVPADNDSLYDYYIYLPAGTVFEEEYNVNCFDTFFVPLNNSDVINSAGIVTRGAYISFNEVPDATKIVIPADVYDFVRFGTMLELAAKDTYYGDRMNVITKTLDSQPENALNYIFITDIHYSPAYFLEESLKNQLELIVKTANEDDSIDFVCIGGDSVNGSAGTKAENLKQLDAVFTPLLDCKKPVFIIQGNHDDGSYKKAPFDIKEMFSHKDWKENIIDKYVNRTLSNRTEIKVVDNSNNDNGNAKYYYYDVENKNTRVIVLDTNDYYMEYDENGTVTALEIRDDSKDDTDHLKYNCAYTYSGYRQKQLKWLAEEALGNLPEGYDVTFLSHMELKRWNSTSETYTYNGDEIIELIGAYQNKTAFTNTNLDINVDYSATQGKVLTFQYGHTHNDKTQYDSDLNLININTTQANGLAYRVLYSETEARFDVMSVTKDSVYRLTVGTTGTTRKIYYAIDTESGDLNFDSSVDICDLVYADLMVEGKKGITTAADINSDGVLETDILSAVRKLLLGK